jgi:serine/threonine protein kinase
MPLIKQPNAEPISGYRLIEPLGRGGFGEVWKCEAPGGLHKAIKFVEGNLTDLGHSSAPASEELQAIQHVKSIRHPFLLSMDRVETIDGELVIVMELADRSLLDLFNERRACGQAGIERGELLGYLREAADVLDLMNVRHGLQHLDVKPANLFLVCDHVKVADFGLVRNVSDRKGDGPPSTGSGLPGAISPRYAAPELFRGSMSPASDQYSLAIVYQELLTGTVPFSGKNARQLALQHTAELPDLTALPASDRCAIARALSKEPRQRFPSCADLIQALQASRASRGGDGPANGYRLGEGTSPLPDPRQQTADTVNDLNVNATFPVKTGPERSQKDYEYLICLSRSPAAEVWEARAPEGHRCLVKFLYGVSGRDARREAEACQRLQALRHSALPNVRMLPGGPGYLVAVTELVQSNLRDCFQKCRNEGKPGVPRRALLDWLRTVAEALDELAGKYGLSHLGLNPRNLLLTGNRVLIGDFGFLPLLWQPVGQLKGQVQARYVAPEVTEGRPGPRCDQYSLAIIYQEMLTGTHPLHGRTRDQLNLAALPVSDRAAVTRALHDDPEQRFASCTEFICALEEGSEKRGGEGTSPLRADGAAGDGIMAELVAHASATMPVAEPESWLPAPDGGVLLQCRFPASLPPGGRLGFEGFRQQWQAETVRVEDNGCVFRVQTPTWFWQRWLGKPAGLLVEIHWTRSLPPVLTLPEVSVCIRAADRPGKAGAALVKDVGPALLECIRAQIQGNPERRSHERLFWAHPVQVTFQPAEGASGPGIEGQVKDISLAGMGLYLPCPVQGSTLRLRLQTALRPEPIDLTGACVRSQRVAEGWFEVGVAIER